MKRPAVAATLRLAVLAVLLSGCGHRVRPTAPFQDAASIPAPFDVTITQEPGAILLSWSAGASPYEHVDGWHVYRRTVMDGPVTRLNRDLLVDVVFRDSLVVEGASYFYSVRAVSPAGVQSAPTHDIEFRYDSVAPEAPTGLMATPGPNAIALTWTAVAAADLAHYRVWRDDVLLAAPVTGAGYVDMPVAAGVVHTYAVSAVDGRGNESPRSAPTQAAAQAAPDVTAPPVPTGLTATLEAGGLRLRWAAVTAPDLAGYLLHRRPAGVGDFARLPGTSLIAALEHLDDGVDPGASYDYAVSAVDLSGNASGLSAPATATWLAPLIETGGNSLGSVYPWCGIASNSGRMQFLIPAEDIGRAGRITELGLWVRSGAAIYHNVTIVLAHTNAAQLQSDFAANRAATLEAGATVHGPATLDTDARPAGSVLPLPLATPFVYDGASALLVDLTWNGDDNRTAVFGFGSTGGPRRRLWAQPASGGGAQGWEPYQQYVRLRFE